MLIFIKRFFQEENAQGMVEYALILALIALAAVTALGFLGEGLNNFFTHVTDELGKLI